MIEIVDAGAMRDFGRRVGERARAGDVIELSGELGAGKTTWVQGLAEGLAEAAWTEVQREVRADHASKMRQGDVVVRVREPGGKDTFYDVKITNPTTRPRVVEAVKLARQATGTSNPVLAGHLAGCALDEAFAGKVKKHSAAVERAGGVFVPLIISALGAVHPESLAALRRLADRIAVRENGSREEAFVRLRTRLSVCFARATGELLRHSLAPQTGPPRARGASSVRSGIAGEAEGAGL